MVIWFINCQHLLVVVKNSELIEIFKYLNSMIQFINANAVKNAIMNFYILNREELKISFIIIIILYHYISLNTYKIVGILFYNQIQNLLYIGSLDISQQQSFCFYYSILYRQ